MKKIYFLIFVLNISLSFAQQTVNVHFRVNTCAVPDTLGKTSTLQVRGNVAPLTWYGDSPVFLTNLEGNDEWGSSDYWIGSAIFPSDTIVQYRIYSNHNDTVYSGASWEHKGWEASIDNPDGHRLLDLTGFTGTDTVLNMQFVNGWQDTIDQYAAPYTSNDSTFVLYFRVNVEGIKVFGFDTTQHKIGIRGYNMYSGGDLGELSWSETYFMQPENNHANTGSQQYEGDNLYSAEIHVPMQHMYEGVRWKFVSHYWNSPANDHWSNLYWNSNLFENVKFNDTGNDTTFYWRWFDRVHSTIFVDTVIVTYRADFTTAASANGFSHGDTVNVKGGWNLTSPDIYRSNPMEREEATNYYSVTDTITVIRGKDYEYNYYNIHDSIEYREIFTDFFNIYGFGSIERRKYHFDSSNHVTINDNEISLSSLRRQPKYINRDSLSRPVTVIYACDLRPAYYRLLAGDTLVDIGGFRSVTNVDSLFAWGVGINGPATGGWQAWGDPLATDTSRFMYDDGTHGDEIAGDSIYSQMYSYTINDIIFKEFKFGIHGGDNEGGFGNNHYENIDDSGDTTFIHSQFGSIDPPGFEPYWDFINQQPVGFFNQNRNQNPQEFILSQNYPNPFNPITNIQYNLPLNEKVLLKVFNVVGEEIITLVDKSQNAGTYSIQWDGRNEVGNLVSSGIYFYRLSTIDYVSCNKMILLR